MNERYNKNEYKSLSHGYFGRFSDARLSADKKNIPLLGGMFQDCSVIYDKNNDSLKLSNSDETYKCCLDNYDFIDRVCFEKCSNIENNYTDSDTTKCKQICNNLRNKWVETCENSKEYKGKLDPFISEAINLKCFDKKTNKIINECIKGNKEIIIKKCMENCIPTGYTNCTDNCNTSYNLINDPKEVSNLFDDIISNNLELSKINKKDSITKSKSNLNIFIYIFIGIIIGIIIIIIINTRIFDSLDIIKLNKTYKDNINYN